MGVIWLLKGMGKNFKICRYPFYKYKSYKEKSVTDYPIIHFSRENCLEILELKLTSWQRLFLRIVRNKNK